MKSLFNWLNGIDAWEEDNSIVISGVDVEDLKYTIERIWNTSIIGKNIFRDKFSLTSNKLIFNKFFLLDTLYILERIIEENRFSRYFPVRIVKQIVEALKEKTWLKNALNIEEQEGCLDFKQLDNFNFQLKEYQRRFLDYYNKTPKAYHLKGALLNGAAGSGKTFSALACMTCAKVDRIIVVCPKNALDRVWVADINEHFKNPPEYWNTNMKEKFSKDTKIFIYHYESLEECIKDHSKDFSRFNYGLILDESHNFNEVKSKRTQLWIELTRLSGSQHILHLSGTPFKALGSESIPLFKVIDPFFDKESEEAYKRIYGQNAVKALDILKNRLGLVSFKIIKEEIGLKPPEMVSRGITIPNGKDFTLEVVKKAMKAFIEERLKYYKGREKNDLETFNNALNLAEEALDTKKQSKDIIRQYRKAVKIVQSTRELYLIKEEVAFCKNFEKNIIVKLLPTNVYKAFLSVCPIIKYLHLKIQGECLGNVVGKMRIQAHVEMCKNIPFKEICNSTEKKTVVFTSYVDVLEEAEKVCKEQKLNPLVVYGKTNVNLASTIKNFEQDISLNPLIATYDSLSTAVPLVMANTLIMINAPFRGYIQEQAISRVHRLRQDTNVVVYQLYLDTGKEPNISSRSLDILAWSQKQVEEITGVKSPYKVEINDDSLEVTTEGFDDSLSLSFSLKDLM